MSDLARACSRNSSNWTPPLGVPVLAQTAVLSTALSSYQLCQYMAHGGSLPSVRLLTKVE